MAMNHGNCEYKTRLEAAKMSLLQYLRRMMRAGKTSEDNGRQVTVINTVEDI
jgi:hypothetical protein